MKWHGIRGVVVFNCYKATIDHVSDFPKTSHAEITLRCCVAGFRSYKRGELHVLLSFHRFPIAHQLKKMRDISVLLHPERFTSRLN